jgi:hypothetical protein
VAGSQGRGFDVVLYSGHERADARRLGHLNPQTQENVIE